MNRATLQESIIQFFQYVDNDGGMNLYDAYLCDLSIEIDQGYLDSLPEWKRSSENSFLDESCIDLYYDMCSHLDVKAWIYYVPRIIYRALDLNESNPGLSEKMISAIVYQLTYSFSDATSQLHRYERYSRLNQDQVSVIQSFLTYAASHEWMDKAISLDAKYANDIYWSYHPDERPRPDFYLID